MQIATSVIGPILDAELNPRFGRGASISLLLTRKQRGFVRPM